MNSVSKGLVNPAAVAALTVASLAAVGCALNATMVPVEGPLSALRPVPVILARADGIMGNTGNITFAMPEGETCKGRWSSAAGAGVTIGAAGLISQYGSAYASGYSVSTGTGQNPGYTLATCSRGRTMQLEFVTGAGTSHGFGIAKDNEGNVFRFVF